jgi:YHS domain-containing protein
MVYKVQVEVWTNGLGDSKLKMRTDGVRVKITNCHYKFRRSGTYYFWCSNNNIDVRDDDEGSIAFIKLHSAEVFFNYDEAMAYDGKYHNYEC